jgi:hypothetical protein
MICGVVENILKAFSRWAGSADWLAWNNAPSSSGHATPRVGLDVFLGHVPFPRTFICVLACELGDGISNLGAHRVVGLVGEALEQLCADGFSLGGVERQEEVGGLAGGRLSRFRRLPPEDDGGKCACLSRVVS